MEPAVDVVVTSEVIWRLIEESDAGDYRVNQLDPAIPIDGASLARPPAGGDNEEPLHGLSLQRELCRYAPPLPTAAASATEPIRGRTAFGPPPASFARANWTRSCNQSTTGSVSAASAPGPICRWHNSSTPSPARALSATRDRKHVHDCCCLNNTIFKEPPSRSASSQFSRPED